MTVRNAELNTNTVSGLPFEYDKEKLENIGSNGGATSINFTVNGFWSYETVYVFVERAYRRKENREVEFYWNARISWGSGGRDTKTVPSDIEAARNFALAVQAAADVAAYVESNTEKFEENYRIYTQKLLEEETERERQRQEKIDNDTKVGLVAAKQLVEEIMSADKYGFYVSARVRGTNQIVPFRVERTSEKRYSFYLHQRVTREEWIQSLANTAEITTKDFR